jgi:hypothetical protein
MAHLFNIEWSAGGSPALQTLAGEPPALQT